MNEHLTRAARARHDATMKKATTALLEMAKASEPITFAAVARRAGISTDFLYNTPALRLRITEIRQQSPASRQPPPTVGGAESTTAIRALSARLKHQRRQHREEIQNLQRLLAAAQGENLELRRRLAQDDK